MHVTTYRGESAFVAILMLMAWLSLRNLGEITATTLLLSAWQLTPVVLFGGLWAFAKRRLARRGYYVLTIASWLAMAMLLNFHFSLAWLNMATGPEHSLMYLYIPFYSLTTGGLASFAVFVVLTIKQQRNEF